MDAILFNEIVGQSRIGVPAPSLAQAQTGSVVEAVGEDGVVGVREAFREFRRIAICIKGGRRDNGEGTEVETGIVLEIEASGCLAAQGRGWHDNLYYCEFRQALAVSRRIAGWGCVDFDGVCAR